MYGYLPVLEECGFSSRHLGLVTPADMEHVTEKIDRLADQMERTVDIQRLLALAHWAPCLEDAACEIPGRRPASVRIGIARDPALCFYYEDNLSMLEQAGAELVPFSPMADRALPEGLCGLYLGGGYPEEHARALSENSGMREEIFRRAHDGMPILAECGGFLYLQRSMADREGKNWPMAGVLDGSGFRPEKQERFGYITLSPTENTPFLKAEESISAHEFHRWDVSDCGSACLAQKPYSERTWPCVIAQGSIFAGFPHLYFPSCPQFPHRFVEACIRYKERMSCPKRD